MTGEITLKILRQLLILFIICTVGAAAGEYISFSGNVLSLVILLALLLTGIIKTHYIKETSEFLIENMAFFYIPPCISIMDSFSAISENIVQIILIVIITTVLTFAVTAYTVTGLMKLIDRKKEK